MPSPNHHQTRYVVKVSEIEIQTLRGATLSGTFVVPVDATDAAVIFSHSLLADRMSGLHFPRLAAMYRRLGYATLKFDYSGHGKSSDDVITTANQVEDLRAASGWLSDQGFARQLLHAHSFGTLAALKARPSAVQTMSLSGAVTGPLSYDWEKIFSQSQLEELEKQGTTTIHDDSPGPRDYFTISQQTLKDLSLNTPEELIDDLEYPILLIHDIEDEQHGLLQMTTDIFPRLPDGSRVEAVRDASFGRGEKLERLSEVTEAWAVQHLPVR